MASFQLPLAAQLAALNAMAGVGGPFHTATLRLYKNNVAVSPDTVLGDLTEADYGGYTAAAAQVFGAAFIAPDGAAHIAAPSVLMQTTDGTGANTIYGAYLTDGAGAVLHAVMPFDGPVPMVVPLDGVLVDVEYVYGK